MYDFFSFLVKIHVNMPNDLKKNYNKMFEILPRSLKNERY